MTTAQGERELSSPFPDEKNNPGFHSFPPLPNHSLGDMDYNVVFYFMNIVTIAWISFILILETQTRTLEKHKPTQGPKEREKKPALLALNTKKETRDIQIYHMIK